MMLLEDVLSNHLGNLAKPTTFTYKTVGDLEIKFDLYHPPDVPATVPVVIYFHAGGLITGDRNSVLPIWLMKRVEAAGFAFISADYRLLPSGGVTGHDILHDVKDLFAFVAATEYEHPANDTRYHIDDKAILATGQSAGALCAFLSNHAAPKPKAIFSLYGMGGDFFAPYYLTPKTAPFYPGIGLLDPTDAMFRDFLYPKSTTTPAVSGSLLTLDNPRNLLLPLYLQLGTFVDYYIGEHKTRITSEHELPEKHRAVFPDLLLEDIPNWPPTFLVHGSADTTIPCSSSIRLHDLLKAKGVKSELVLVEGCDHGFDYMPGSDEKHAELYDRAIQFLKDNA